MRIVPACDFLIGVADSTIATQGKGLKSLRHSAEQAKKLLMRKLTTSWSSKFQLHLKEC